MQADPWWSFAMAVNVYLVFFYNVRPSVFRQYAWVYCAICYGGPLITAIALISIRNDERGLIYGDAVVSPDRDVHLRLSFFANTRRCGVG